MESNIYILIANCIGGIFLLWLLFYFVPLGLWFTAITENIQVTLLELVLMRWRKVPPRTIIFAMITLKKAGIEPERDELEALYLAGGNVNEYVKGMIYARTKKIQISKKEIFGFILSDKDVIKELDILKPEIRH